MPTLSALTVVRVPLDTPGVPVVLGRDEAARIARAELSKPQYSGDDRPLVARVLSWILDRISELLDKASTGSPLGWFGLVGLILIVVAVVVVVRRRTGGLGRGTTVQDMFGTGERSAADHRREAERYAAAGAYAEAVRERLRAVVRDLEDRGLLDARPGRTADEAAHDAGHVLPTVSADLRRAARTFDDVWYGGQVADASTYSALVAVDDAVAAARPRATSPARDAAFLVPR